MVAPVRTRAAMLVYWAAGVLSRVRTWQRVYEVATHEPLTVRRLPRRWASCATSTRLLVLSTRLDPTHWDHWALQHNDCEPRPCTVCGGHICED